MKDGGEIKTVLRNFFRNMNDSSGAEYFLKTFWKYELQQSSIVTEMVGVSQGYCDSMSHLSRVISKLDIIVSFAVTAVEKDYSRPALSEDSGVIKIKQVG